LIMNELFKLRPVLFVQKDSVASVNIGWACFDHGNLSLRFFKVATAK
jgi:hypothetical protein